MPNRVTSFLSGVFNPRELDELQAEFDRIVLPADTAEQRREKAEIVFQRYTERRDREGSRGS